MRATIIILVRIKTTVRFARTTKKAASISVKGPNLWNALNTEVTLCNSIAQFKKKYKCLLLEKI